MEGVNGKRGKAKESGMEREGGREEGREEGRKENLMFLNHFDSGWLWGGGAQEARHQRTKENLRRGRGRHGETATEARAGDRWTILTSVLRRKTEQKAPAGHLLWVWRQPALAVP